MNRGKSRQVLSTKQLFAILISGILGHGLVSFARTTVLVAAHDAWVSIILAGLVALLGVNVILFLMKNFSNQTFIEISEMVLGKYLGKIPGIMLFTYYIILASMSLRVMADLVSSWLLPETPIEIIMLSVLGILYYLTRNGIKVLGRFNEVILWILIPVIPLILVPFFQHSKMINVLPLMDGGLMRVLEAALPSMYAFLGFESLLILYPFVRKDASHMEVVKTVNFAVIIVILFKTFVVFSNIATFGAIEMEFLLYPMLEYFKLTVFPVIERVEFLLIFYWLFVFFGAIALNFSMTNLSIEQTLKIQGYKNTGLFLVIPLYYLTRVPQNAAEVFSFISLLGTWGPVWIFASIFLVFLVALICGRRKSNEA